MKKLMFIAVLLTLAGCGDPSAKDSTDKWMLPDGLKDCKIYSLSNGKGSYMQVVRCPNSATTSSYTQGKTSTNITLVEDEKQ